MAITVQALDPPFSATQRFLVTGGTVGDTITAAIDDTTIATVSPASQSMVLAGVTFTVTGVAPGATTLHITDTTSGDSIPWTINVSGAPIPSVPSVTIGIGQSVTIELFEKNDPNPFTTIASADSSIATCTVSSNAIGDAFFVVTGVSAGNTVVNYDDGHGNTGTVTVSVVSALLPNLVQKSFYPVTVLHGDGQPTGLLPNNPTIGNLIIAVVTRSFNSTPNDGWTLWATTSTTASGFQTTNGFAVFTRIVQFGDSATLSPCGNASGDATTYLLEFEGVNTANPFNCASFINVGVSHIARYVHSNVTSSWNGTTHKLSLPQIIPDALGCVGLYIAALSGSEASLGGSISLGGVQQPNYADTWDNVIAADSPRSTWYGSGGPYSALPGHQSSSTPGPQTVGAGVPVDGSNNALPFTLEFIFGSDTGGGFLFSQGHRSTGGAGISVYKTGGGGWAFNYNGFIGVTPAYGITGGNNDFENATDPLFTHLAITFDGSKMRGFVNGNLCGEHDFTGISFLINGSNPTVGALGVYNPSSGTTYSQNFSGDLNAFACFSGALDPSRIWEHYQSMLDTMNGTVSSPLADQYTSLFWDDFNGNPILSNCIALRNDVTSDTTTPLEADITLASCLNPLAAGTGYEASAAGLLFLNAAQAPPPPVPPTPSGRSKLIIRDKQGNLVMAADGAGMVGSSFTDEINGGNTVATVVLNRKFINLVGIIDYDYRVQFWLPDSVDPWWDGFIVEFDPEQQQDGELITLQCEGWHTYLARAIVSEQINPGLQPNGVNNGAMYADTWLAHILATYVDSSKLGASFLSPIPFSLDKIQFDGTELNQCLDTIVKSVEDNSGHTFEWWVRGVMTQGQPGDGKPAIVIQPNQIPNAAAGVGYALVTGRLAPTAAPVTYGYQYEFKDSTIYDYKIQNSSRELYNMIALYGGKDPTTQQQVYGAYKDSTSISLYGLRQKKVTKSDLLSTQSLANYATVWILLHAYPQPQGSFKCFIPHDGRRAGRWHQIHIPGDSSIGVPQAIQQVRAVKVITGIEDIERIYQEVYTTAPRPYIDHASYSGAGGAVTHLGTSTKRLNTTQLAEYFVSDGFEWVS